MAIDVTRDVEGMVQALGELLEEEFAFQRVRRVLDQAADDDRDHAMRSLPARALSPGYYRWAAYLLWLETRLDAGIRFDRLDVAEMDGLVALKRARNEWNSKHPACACGARQEGRFSQRCHECGIEFRRREVA